MTCSDFSGLLTAPATDRCDRCILEVASGRRTIDKAWHQLRGWQPSLQQWEAFGTVCRNQDRKSYTKVWARHQWLCWTELSNEGTYPQQRADWAAKQARFEADMAAKSGRAVRTNAELKAAAKAPEPEPDHIQLGLLG